MEGMCKLFHTGDVFWPSSGEPPREGPMVRIRAPPAESPCLTQTRPMQVENRAFRAGVRPSVGGAVGGDAQDRAISRQRTPISLSGLIPVPRSAADAV